jgi:hypothetical protein
LGYPGKRRSKFNPLSDDYPERRVIQLHMKPRCILGSAAAISGE